MAALVLQLGQSPPPSGLREVLARSLGDPDLELAYPLGDPERLVDATGTAIEPATRDGRAVTPLTRRGETVALLSHRPGLLEDPAIADEVIAATRLAVDNERLQAEVLAQLQELRASGPASSPPATPNGGGSNATCTTVPSSASSASPSRYAWPAPSPAHVPTRTSQQCSTRQTSGSWPPSASSANWPTASIPRP